MNCMVLQIFFGIQNPEATCAVHLLSSGSLVTKKECLNYSGSLQ